MDPWVWMGQRYEAASVRVPGGGALSAEQIAALGDLLVAHDAARPHRLELRGVIGQPGARAVHVALSARAARIASHSRSATTARKLWMRTTRAPAMPAIDDSSTDTSGGAVARAGG